MKMEIFFLQNTLLDIYNSCDIFYSEIEKCIFPWQGLRAIDSKENGNNTFMIQQEILNLSKNEDNFLIEKDQYAFEYEFNFEEKAPVALKMIQEDERLNQMRIKLVPKKISNENFWKNYFYCIEIIKMKYKVENQIYNNSKKINLEVHDKTLDKSQNFVNQKQILEQKKSEIELQNDKTSLLQNNIHENNNSQFSVNYNQLPQQIKDKNNLIQNEKLFQKQIQLNQNDYEKEMNLTQIQQQIKIQEDNDEEEESIADIKFKDKQEEQINFLEHDSDEEN